MSKMTGITIVLMMCLCICVLTSADADNAKISGGVMFRSSEAGPFINLSSTFSSQQNYNLVGSAGVAFFDVHGGSLTLIPVMLNLESKPTKPANAYFGGGVGILFASGEGDSDSDFGYQIYGARDFGSKMFGEAKIIGGFGDTAFALSIGTRF